MLPPFAAIENPIDVTAQTVRDPSILGRTAAQLLADPAMGSLVVSIVAGAPRFAMDKAARSCPASATSKNRSRSPPWATRPTAGGIFRRLPREGPAIYRSPDRALRAMARATWYGHAVTATRPQAEAPRFTRIQDRASGALTEYQGKELLAMLGIAVPEGALARDLDEASEIAERIGYPVVLKAQAAALAHKSDAGGVILNIADEATLCGPGNAVTANIRKARPDLALDGVLVEAMAPPGLEMVVGARREPKWGPIVTVGLGGIWIEALHDIRILPADLDRDGIIDELHKLKGAALLRGGRGTPAADLAPSPICVARSAR